MQLEQWFNHPVTKALKASISQNLDELDELSLSLFNGIESDELVKQINIKRGYKMAWQDMDEDITTTLDAFNYLEEEEENEA